MTLGRDGANQSIVPVSLKVHLIGAALTSSVILTHADCSNPRYQPKAWENCKGHGLIIDRTRTTQFATGTRIRETELHERETFAAYFRGRTIFFATVRLSIRTSGRPAAPWEQTGAASIPAERHGSKMGAEITKGLAIRSLTPRIVWLQGSDLNRRPLGYESSRGCAGNPLISHRTLEVVSN